MSVCGTFSWFSLNLIVTMFPRWGHGLSLKRKEMIIEFTKETNVKTNLDPAMKPRMRAFSGLVTLLAVLNISCASNIWSFVSDKFLRCPGTEATGVVMVCTAG